MTCPTCRKLRALAKESSPIEIDVLDNGRVSVGQYPDGCIGKTLAEATEKMWKLTRRVKGEEPGDD